MDPRQRSGPRSATARRNNGAYSRPSLPARIARRMPVVPSALHVQIELALWVCATLLTASSSLVLYKHSYLSTTGDLAVLFAISAWLGRHFLLRLICTLTSAGVRSPATNNYGGGRRRRREFRRWMHRNRPGSLYHRAAYWLGKLSPNSLLDALGRFVRGTCMAGQWCDSSSGRALPNAALILSSAANQDDYSLNKKGSGGSSGAYAGGSFGYVPVPTNESHVRVLLGASRLWGTSCGLSYAVWAVVRGEGKGVRGAVGELIGIAGGLVGASVTSFLGMLGVQAAGENSGGGRGPSFGDGATSGGRRKKKQGGRGDDASSRGTNPAGGSGLLPADDSLLYGGLKSNSGNSNGPLDTLTAGKLSFRLFPSAVRSQALHVQQLQTSEMYRTLEKVWEACPPSQLAAAGVAACLLAAGWLFVLGGHAWLSGGSAGTSGMEYQTVESNVPHFGGPPGYGHGGAAAPDGGPGASQQEKQASYWRGQAPFLAPATFDVTPPGWTALILLVTTFGTLASLLLYGRVLLPIPEFVAGTNVLKAVRAETRLLGGGSSLVRGPKFRDLPWAEQYKSVTTENRLRLYYKVAVVRIVENILLCAILPQTEIVCRISGHCESGPLLWGPSGVTGISGRRFGKGSSFLTTSYDTLLGDDFCTRLVITTTVVITAVLLIAQMTVSDRTYLAILGYISGEWELVPETSSSDDGDGNNDSGGGDDSGGGGSGFPLAPGLLGRFRPLSWAADVLGLGSGSSSSSSRSSSGSSSRRPGSMMQWDPKRRYRKGDRIAYEDSVYEAASNSPEGPPFDPFLRAAHDLFSDELGHPSASHMLPCLSMGCLVLASMLLSALLIWRNAGWYFQPLLLCLFSSLLAGYAITHSTERAEYRLERLGAEIPVRATTRKSGGNPSNSNVGAVSEGGEDGAQGGSDDDVVSGAT